MFNIEFSAMGSEGFSGAIIEVIAKPDSDEAPLRQTLWSFVFIRAKKTLDVFDASGNGPIWSFYPASAVNQAGFRGIAAWLQKQGRLR